MNSGPQRPTSPEFSSDELAPVGFGMEIPGRDFGNQFLQSILAVGGLYEDHAMPAHAQIQRVPFPQAGSLKDSPPKPSCQAVSPLHEPTSERKSHIYLQRTSI